MVAVIGTVLLAFLKGGRVTGYLAAAVGALLCWLAYALFDP